LECLSGIPGRVGATPIQNVGAYGQEVGEHLHHVRVVDRESLEVRTLSPDECELGYRDSVFKRQPDRYVVTEVGFALVPDGAPTVRYTELERALIGAPDASSLATVRDAVLALRRKKSMVIDEDDPNRRSAGSFFTNPIVSASIADRLVERAVADGLVPRAADVPRWEAAPAPDGTPRTKLAAGWLIERAGIAKGTRAGSVGISSKHALALVHHGGGTASELLTLARRVRDAVRDRFGVTITPEPTLWGFAVDPLSIG
jgi:UDP-N-acetylmuramate dehydrogenase